MKDSTERVIEIFDQINTVPRRSGNLEQIHPWLMNWARRHGFEAETDEIRNIVVRVPGTPGYENAPTVIIQGHMDMVCEKNPDVEHDFKKDPIISWRDGDWLRAKGTSLGADNAIAIAMGFELITDTQREHPPLEILITMDEETGLVGAQNIDPKLIKGKILINLDSEDDGIFTIGCAGGMDTNITLPFTREKAPENGTARMLTIAGLQGGHSGVEIQDGLGNANVLLIRALDQWIRDIPELRIASLQGGSAHNAIPRDAQALLVLPRASLETLEKAAAAFNKTVKAENAQKEPNLEVSLKPGEIPQAGLMNKEDTQRIINTLRLIPHGVKNMSALIPEMVETSMNFAIMQTEEQQIKILTNQRSAITTRGQDLSHTMENLAFLGGGTMETGNHYPPWEPQEDSPLLARCLKLYTGLFKEEPLVDVVHAGLECGAIGSRIPGLDMISFGPTIKQPHSPDERLDIPSLKKACLFLRELLKSYRS